MINAIATIVLIILFLSAWAIIRGGVVSDEEWEQLSHQKEDDHNVY